MKKIVFLFLIIPSVIFSQCPDGKANEYKQKAAQYGDASYSTLAVYYYYKCQCENGIANRTVEQVNSMVDQYNGLKANKAGSNSISLPNQHQVQWINISKVSKCSNSKSLNSKNDEGSNQNETKKKANPFFTNDFIEENIINLINGDTDKALSNISNEIQVKNTMKNTGLDRQTSQALNDLGTTIGSEIAKNIEEKRLVKSEKALIYINNNYDKSHNIRKKSNNSISYSANFNDDYWVIKENDFINVKIIDDNTCQIKYKKKIETKRKKSEDLIFMFLKHPSIDLYSDFKITYTTEHKTDNLGKKYIRTPYSFLIGANNKVCADANWNDFIRTSFTPVINRYSFMNKNTEIKFPTIPTNNDYREFIKNLAFGTPALSNEISLEDFVKNKQSKRIIKKLKDYKDEIIQINYTITKKNNLLFLNVDIKTDLKTDTFKSGSFEYKYLSDNLLTFSAMIGDYFSSVNNTIENKSFVLKDFKIEQ